MKKTLLIIAVAMLTAFSVQAQGFKFGLRGGVNLTSLSLSESAMDNLKSNSAGFYVGPTVKFTLPLIGLSFDASALYDQRKAEVDGDDLTTRSLAIPVNVRYGWGLGSLADIFLFAGPQIAFNFADGPTNWTMNKSQFSVNVGIGTTLFSHLEVKANYNIACGKTAEFQVADVATNFTAKSNAWQIGLAYWF